MAEQREQRCETCRFWDTDDGWAGDGFGYCMRFPPSQTVHQSNCEHPVGFWPATMTVDWCGEWQPAGDLPRIDVDALELTAIGLNVRAMNGLENAEPPIVTVGQLRSVSVDQLKMIRNMGEGTIRHIRQQLAKNGLALRGERVILPPA